MPSNVKCYVIRGVKCWCFFLIRISLKNAPFATSLGSLWRRTFRVYYHSSLSALRAMRRALRVHAPCVMWFLFFEQIHTNRPPAGSSILAFVFKNVGVFRSYVSLWKMHRSQHLWVPCEGTRFGYLFYFYFLFRTFTFQLLDKPWSQVSTLLPPPVRAFIFYRAEGPAFPTLVDFHRIFLL